LIARGQPAGSRIRWLPRPEGGRQVFSPNGWSADGRRLAGTLEQTDRSQVPGVVVYSLDSRQYERITEVGAGPVWLHDNRTLLYRQEGKIFAHVLGARASKLLLEPPPNSTFRAVATSPDDRTLYTVRETDEGDVWMLTLKDDAER
jgi:hypothetical protein